MEPRFFKRGNDLVITETVNGLIPLQWNHAFSSVEILEQSYGLLTSALASMEPRFFKRGN